MVQGRVVNVEGVGEIPVLEKAQREAAQDLKFHLRMIDERNQRYVCCFGGLLEAGSKKVVG